MMSNDLCERCNNCLAEYDIVTHYCYGMVDGIKTHKDVRQRLCGECYRQDKESIKKDPMPNKLTPIEIEALMRLDGIRQLGVFGISDAIISATKNLIAKGLVVEEDSERILTERGRILVEALCLTPLPIQKWVMPGNDENK